MNQKILTKRNDLISAVINIIGLFIFTILLIQLIENSIILNNSSKIFQSILIIIVITIFFIIQIYYHILQQKNIEAKLWQRIDRGSMLFLISLIFTPILLNFTQLKSAIIIVSIQWSLSIVGMVILIFKKKISRSLAPILTFLIGIIGIVYFSIFLSNLNLIEIIAFIAGSIFLILAGVIYVVKKPNLIANIFEFHELFHSFLTIGCLMLFYLIRLAILS